MINKKILIATLLTALSLKLAAAVFTQVDKTNISNIEQIELTISVQDSGQNTPPDLSELKKDFIIVTQSENTFLSIVNNKRTSRFEWIYKLEPKRSGLLQIPSFKVGNSKSTPIPIKVNTLSQTDFSKQSFFLTSQVSHKAPYVQEQLVYTVNLYSKQKVSVNLNIPINVEKAIVQNLNINQAVKQTTYQGKKVWVKSYQYAIFPQEVGQLVIPRIKQTVYIINNNRRRSSLVLYTPAIELNVKPIDEKYPINQHWLPASKVELSAKFITNPPVFQVGEVVEREINLNVVGQSKLQLPELQLQSTEALEQYQDTQKLSQKHNNKNLIASLNQKVIIVPNQPGQQVLPEVKVHWFDTLNQTNKTTTLKAQSIEVLAGNIDDHQIKNQPVKPKINKSVVAKLPEEIQPTDTTEVIPSYYWALVYALAGLWLLTIIFFWLKLYKPKIKSSNKNVINLKEKTLLNAIKTACNKNNPKAAKAALNAWVIATKTEFININEFANTLNNADFSDAIHQLDTALHKEQEWQGKQFYQLYKKAIQPDNNNGGSSITNLYPRPLV